MSVYLGKDKVSVTGYVEKGIEPTGEIRFEKLAELVTEEEINNGYVNVPEQYQDYNVVKLVFENINLSAADWFYCSINSQGLLYANKNQNLNDFIISSIYSEKQNMWHGGSGYLNKAANSTNMGTGKLLRIGFKCYSSATNILPGLKIKVYGLKVEGGE